MIDPLSDVLMLLRPRRQAAGAVDFGGDWSVRVPATRGVRCYAVGRGDCWIEVEDFNGAVHLVRDDCVLLASGRAFRIGSASDAGLIGRFDPAVLSRDGISRVNGGAACFLIGGHFLLDIAHEQLLSSALPPLVVVQDQGQRDALGAVIKGLWLELETAQPGGRLVIDHLNQMMLIFALRLCVSSNIQRPTGWLSALADKRLSRALGAIHGSPEKPWTLQALAGEAGMSRTVFAGCFKALVGFTPVAYLYQWRMAIAVYSLRASNMPVSQVAVAVGYGSATSLSTAFRKAFGVAPRDFARTLHEAEQSVESACSLSSATLWSRSESDRAGDPPLMGEASAG